MEVDQSLEISQKSLFDRAVLFLAAGMFALMIVLATAQVLVRMFNLPFSVQWTEPAARLILIIGTFFGAAVATRNREHIRMTYVLDKMEERWPKIKKPFDLISSTVVTIFVLFALAGTTTAAVNNWESNLGGVGFATSGMIYLGISLGLFCMLLYECQLLYRDHLADWFGELFDGRGDQWS